MTESSWLPESSFQLLLNDDDFLDRLENEEVVSWDMATTQDQIQRLYERLQERHR